MTLKLKTLNLSEIASYKKCDFSLINKDERFNLTYKGENFVIDCETLFENCSMYSQKKNKIKINFTNDSDNKYFLNIIRHLYDIISELIEENDEINVTKVINPIFTKDNTKMLFIMISEKSEIKNIDNDIKVNINDLYDKSFHMYPIFYSPNINIYNENIYINFNIHTIFVKSISDINIYDTNISLDYDKIKKIMKKK